MRKSGARSGPVRLVHTIKEKIMERLQGTYEVGGFLFKTEEEAELAKRELEGVKFIKQKTDLKNPATVLQVYQNLIRQDLFETPIGYCFLKELRDYLLMIPAVRNEEVAAITIRYPEHGEEKKRQKKEHQTREKAKSKDKKEHREKNADYKTRCHFFMITTLILAISVATMMVLAGTSDHINILNYENKIIDKYSAWEQELEEREQQLKELEEQ